MFPTPKNDKPENVHYASYLQNLLRNMEQQEWNPKAIFNSFEATYRTWFDTLN